MPGNTLPMVLSTPNRRLSFSLAAGAVSATVAPAAGEYCNWAVTRTSAAGSLTIKRSTDGGSTWKERTDTTRGNSTLPDGGGAYLGAAFRFAEAQGGALYRAEANGGTFDVIVRSDTFPAQAPSGYDQIAYCRMLHSYSPSAQQIQTLYNTVFTPVADADLLGTITLYKRLQKGLLAKLSVPSGAQRARSEDFVLGFNRAIRAEYTDCLAVFDGNGNAAPTGTGLLDPGAIYTPGQRTVARDVLLQSSGTFTDLANSAGIYGYPTLIEAVANPIFTGEPTNLTALGL